MKTSNPTQFELASLAATLASNFEAGKADFKAICDDAYRLWNAAGETLQEQRHLQSILDAAMAKREEFDASIRFPKSFPCSFKETLIALMPKQDAADRLPLFKEFLRWWLWVSFYLEPPSEGREMVPHCEQISRSMEVSDDEVLDELSNLRDLHSTEQQFRAMALMFHQWEPEYSAFRRSAAGRAAAKAKAEKAASLKKKSPAPKKRTEKA